MANIIPFKGLRYNQEKVSNLAAVVTPPYDIIDENAQARYYAEQPANIIRLELGLIFSQDTTDNNRYTRAIQYLEKWLQDEILISENKPALYVYQQEFNLKGTWRTRTGFICGLKVEPYETGNILPHEETLSKPKADRLQLIRATRSNFSSIFGLFSDEERSIDRLLLDSIANREPSIDITDESNETHKIWVVEDEEIINQVVKKMANKPVYIADGHHRYETALEYAREMQEQGKPGYDYVMTTLVNLFDEGLLVLPTHRVVGNMHKFEANKFMQQLHEQFEVQECGSKENFNDFMSMLEKQRETKYCFGMYFDDNLYLLVLKNLEAAKQELPAEKSDAWKELDVALLDYLILDKMLGIGKEQRLNQENLVYSRDEHWVIEQVANNKYQIGFFLNPTQVEDIVKVAQAQDKMPQKSTYFYPKLITGLVINNLNIK